MVLIIRLSFVLQVARSENQVSDIIDKFVNDFEMKNREALCSDEYVLYNYSLICNI